MRSIARNGLLTTVLTLVVSASAVQAAPPQWRELVPPARSHVFLALTADSQGNVFSRFYGGAVGEPNMAGRPPAGAWSTFDTADPSIFCCFDAANNATFAFGNGTVTGGFRPAGAAAPSSTQSLGTGHTNAGIPGDFSSIAVNASGASITAFPGTTTSTGPLKVFERAAGAASSFVDKSSVLPGSPTTGSNLFAYAGSVIDADGSGAVVYDDAAGSLQVYSRSNAGVWTGPVAIGERSDVGPGFGNLKMVSNAAGDTLLVWRETDAGALTKGAFRPRDGVFGAPATIGSATAFTGLSAAVASDGTAYVPVLTFTGGRKPCGPSGPTQPYETELMRRDPGTGAWGSVGGKVDGRSGAVAASRANGHVAFAWTGYHDLCVAGRDSLAIRARLGTGTALGGDSLLPGNGPPQPGGIDNDLASVVIDSAGRATVLWRGGSSSLRSAAFDDGTAGAPPPDDPPPPDPGPGGSGGSGGSNPGSAQEEVDKLLGIRPPRYVKVSIGAGRAGGGADLSVEIKCNAKKVCEVVTSGFILGSYRGPGRGGVVKARAKVVKFKIPIKKRRTLIPAGKKKRVKIKISRAATKKIRRALTARGKVRLKLGVNLDGRKGKTRTIPFKAVKRKAR